MSKNSLGTKKNLTVAGKDYEIFDISTLSGAHDLPFSLKILLENLLTCRPLIVTGKQIGRAHV